MRVREQCRAVQSSASDLVPTLGYLQPHSHSMQRVCACAVVVVAALAGLAAAGDSDNRDWWDSGITVVQRSLQECEAAKDVAACLKVKAIRTMDRALNTGEPPPASAPWMRVSAPISAQRSSPDLSASRVYPSPQCGIELLAVPTDGCSA